MKEVTFYILDVCYVNDSTCNVRRRVTLVSVVVTLFVFLLVLYISLSL